MRCLWMLCLRGISRVAPEGRGPKATGRYMLAIAPPTTYRFHHGVYAYLVEVDDRLPEGVLHLVEISHADLSEVTWMVFVEIGAVVMLATGHTTTTRMLSVLADTSVTGGDMTAAVDKMLAYFAFEVDDGRAESALVTMLVLEDILFPRFRCSGRHCDGVDGAMLESLVLRTFGEI